MHICVKSKVLAKKKHTISVEINLEFALIGISSHQKIHKLCWAINKKLNFELAKSEDINVTLKKGVDGVFSCYDFEDSVSGCKFYLLENKKENLILLPEQKIADFFLIVDGPYDAELIERIIPELNGIEFVNKSFLIDETKIINKQNLYFLL